MSYGMYFVTIWEKNWPRYNGTALNNGNWSSLYHVWYCDENWNVLNYTTLHASHMQRDGNPLKFVGLTAHICFTRKTFSCYFLLVKLVDQIWSVLIWHTVKPLVEVAPNPKNEMFLVSSCSCLRSIHWGQVLSWEWRCSWSSADRQCSYYIWVINNFIAY